MKVRLRIGNGSHRFSGDPKALKTLMAIVTRISKEGTRENGFEVVLPTAVNAHEDVTYPGIGSVRVFLRKFHNLRNEYDVILLEGRVGSWLSNL